VSPLPNGFSGIRDWFLVLTPSSRIFEIAFMLGLGIRDYIPERNSSIVGVCPQALFVEGDCHAGSNTPLQNISLFEHYNWSYLS
jgi:hypothetical protein